MIYIQEVKGREILESRGLPTIEVEITLSNGVKVSASAPSGTSYGSDEPVEVRDKDMSRYHGYGVLRAVNNVNKTIAPRLYKKDPLDQFEIDGLLNELDDTPNKAHLGVNTILATSMAVAKAGASSHRQSLFEYLNYLYSKQYDHLFNSEEAELSGRKPTAALQEMKMPEPIFNMINGRESEISRLNFQDFMIILKGIPDYKEKIRYASEIDHQIQKNLAGKDYYYTSLSNEGGFTPDLANDQGALEIMLEALKPLDPKISSGIFFGIDVAATGLYNNVSKIYKLQFDGKVKDFTSDEMINHLFYFSNRYPIIFFEDGLAVNDQRSWKNFMQKAPAFMGVVGDDLFCGNVEKVKRNEKEKWANAVSIKPNQIGSVTDILNFVIEAQQVGLKIMVSHRSGETNDDYICDLAVAVGAEYFKSGAPRKGERVAKYNRLLTIEEELDIINKTK